MAEDTLFPGGLPKEAATVPVANLGISPRETGALVAAGIQYASDLARKEIRELVVIPGITQATLQRLREAVAALHGE